MRNTCSGHFYLIVNFKVTVRKYMPLYNLKGYFNINRKQSSSVKACSINKLTVYIICKMHCNCVVFLQTYIQACWLLQLLGRLTKKLLKITCYKYLFVRTLQLLTAIIVFLSNVRDISYLETLVDKKCPHVTLSHQVTNASIILNFINNTHLHTIS